PPPGFSSTAPGTVLRSRQVDVGMGPVPLGVAFRAYQLLYRTNDGSGRPVATVTTVLVPTGLAPAGGRGLLSLNTAEDSVDPNCAPSYQLRAGQTANGGSGTLLLESTIGVIGSELLKGLDVV